MEVTTIFIHIYLITNILGYITQKRLSLCLYFILLGYQHAMISTRCIYFYHKLFNHDVTKQNALWVKMLQQNGVLNCYEMGSRWFSGVFHYRKDQQLYGYLFSIKEVLSFPLIPPVTNISKDQCSNDKHQFGILFEPTLNGRGLTYGIRYMPENSCMPATDLNMTVWTCFRDLFIKIWNHFKSEW